ncbi:MAG: hypothetical protein ABW352_00850 [Polyangiales bacterium]
MRQNPLDFAVLDELRQHCESTGSFAVWAEALEHHARAANEAEVDPVELGRLHFELGNLYRDQLGQSELALNHYRTAMDFDAAQRPAIAAARKIYAEAGAWPNVAELLAQEAESLPAGLKRAAAYAELAELQRERLGDREEAVNSLLEAIEAAPEDLQPRHQLATMLLDDADHAPDAQDATDKRDTAADLLAGMASEVSDDYALAYLEAALDAVPDHEDSLTQLEALAPRMQRGDVLAPRWLGAIRAGRDPALTRSLRLKMARAYIAVGQLPDARICLEPLLSRGDDEAESLAKQSVRPPPPDAEELLSAELLLDEVAASDEPVRESFADELAAIDSLGKDEARDPLADLAMLDRADSEQALDEEAPAGKKRKPESEPTASVGRKSKPPRKSKAPAEGKRKSKAPRNRESQPVVEPEPPLEDLASALEPDSAAGAETILEITAREAVSAPEPTAHERVTSVPPAPMAQEEGRAGSAPPPLPSRRASEPPAEPLESAPPRHSSTPPPLPKCSEPPKPAVYTPPSLDDDADPFAEQTQPRAQPLTLAELNALTGEDQNLIFAPQAEDVGDSDVVESEVTHVSPAEDPGVAELRGLRTELAKRLRFRDRRGAAEVAEALLAQGIFDNDAIHAMEEHYRLSRDFKKLRDLCEQLAAEPSFGKDARAGRLREAVLLSESKLGDQEGAVRNLRSLLALEPDDAEAFAKLRTSLRRAQSWNDLAELLKSRADSIATGPGRAELYRELGALQREKRSDHEAALSAYASAAELDPGNVDDAVVLSGLYAGAGRYAEAAAAYELRVEHAQPNEQPGLLATLAQIYEDKLHEDERAQYALERWRALAPNKPEPLNALVRVLERRGEFRALVDALTTQLEQVPAAQRGPLHARIAQVAFDKLGDAQRAADSYGEAIVRAPQDASLWQQATPAYEKAGRGQELDELLWGIANSSRDRANSSLVFDHLAITREARGDQAGAITAREAQYALTQEITALAALVSLLRTAGRPSELSRRLDELARKSNAEEARTLRFERATLLAEQLRDPEAAKAELERILSELNADDATALRKLVELCKLTGDVKRRASAQERLIKLAPSLAARVELAVELIDIYEQELEDLPGAVRVLNAWTSLEPENPTPYVRLLPLLAQTGKKRDLILALDKLAELSITDEESGEFTLRAARVAMEIEDWDGAWNRLVPRVVEHDDITAERMLREVTKQAQRGEQLSSLFVGLAQRATSPEYEQRRWRDAARAFEQELGAYDRALEATLRALAKQLDNRELLAEAERLSGKANAWPRLGQVYDTIVRKADRTDTRIELLMRHARLLEHEAKDEPSAFERVWLAFQLDPANDLTYGEAKRLAIATGRREELLGSYERRTQSNASRESRLEALLDACALAQHELDDTARATGYLSRAVALAGDSAELLLSIEKRVRVLDAEEPPVSGRGLVAELAGVYEALAPEYPRTPQLPSTWLARAAKIHEKDLQDPVAAFRALERASALMPSDESLLDELSRVAALSQNWEALAKHLQHAADVAIDSNSSSAALRRLGSLCERELSSPSRAADAYEQLVRLRPKDGEASRRLRHCLKQAERHDELLIAIDRELFVLKPEEKRELLKQAAETWEFGLKNRYEAVDAWKKVVAIAPADPDAVAALARLRIRPRADDSLLEGDVVVTSEDLRPSMVAATVVASAAPASSSLFGSNGAGEGSSAFMRRESAVEPERVTHEDLSLLSGEFGTQVPKSDELLVGTRDFDADMTMPLEAKHDPELTLPLSEASRQEDEEEEKDEEENGEQLEASVSHDPDVTLPVQDADAPLRDQALTVQLRDVTMSIEDHELADEATNAAARIAELAPLAAAASEPPAALSAGLSEPPDDFGEDGLDHDEEVEGDDLASAEILVDEATQAKGRLPDAYEGVEAPAHEALDEHEELELEEHEELEVDELLDDDDDEVALTQPPPASGSLASLSSLVGDARGSSARAPKNVTSIPPKPPASRPAPPPSRPPPPPPRARGRDED